MNTWVQKNKQILIVFTISTILLGVLFILTLIKYVPLITLDTHLNAYIPMLHGSPIANTLMLFVTTAFDAQMFLLWCIPLLLIIAFYFGRRLDAALLFFGIGGLQTVKTIMKYVSDKARPENTFDIIAHGSSFPSGHSATAVFFFLALLLLFTRNISNLSKKLRLLLQSLLIFGILIVPLSRVFLQVHYTSDIIAGALLGIASLSFSIMVFDYIKEKYPNF